MIPSRLPEEIMVEVTTNCNLNCKMCPRTAMSLPKRDMEFSVYEQILNRIPSLKTLILTGWGEPLVHPQFIDMVCLGRQKFPRAVIRFATNGYLLNEDLSKKFIENEVDQISISIDDISDDNSFGHPHSRRVLENVEALRRLKEGRSKPLICFQTLLQKNGTDSVRQLIDAASELGVDYLNLLRLDTRLDSSISRPEWAEERSAIRELRAYSRKKGMRFFCINDPSLPMKLASHRDKICLRTDNHAYIDLDGNMTPCCKLREQVAGNMLGEPIEKLWNSPVFKRFREGQPGICRGCDVLKHYYHS
ncbi:MAG: radical SAM protein [Candidatus Hydrogenedentota bacterium]|nr:MAG: radical SAM protein [Candidatus Hydrogenedentota bacterium]